MEFLILVSSLAEGADRMVARMAMDKFNMALHVPLPLPYDSIRPIFKRRSHWRRSSVWWDARNGTSNCRCCSARSSR